MPDILPQQRIDPFLSKSGALKGLLWGGATLLLTIVGNLITQWLNQQFPNSALHSILVSSNIGSNWLPPIPIMVASIIIGFIAYLFVRRAQSAKQGELDEVKRKLEKLNQGYQNCIDSLTSFQRGRNDKHRDEVAELNREITQWKQKAETSKDIPESIVSRIKGEGIAEYKWALNKEELESLIKPLYLEFDKYPDIDASKRKYKGLSLSLSLMADPNNADYKMLVPFPVEFSRNSTRRKTTA